MRGSGIHRKHFYTTGDPDVVRIFKQAGVQSSQWVFGPVWALLYLLMGIALFIVWRKGLKTPYVKPALIVFGIQLILNALWSLIFFGLASPLGGFIEIIFLWLAILATIILFLIVSFPAGLLLFPYILWVSYAAVLNYYIYILN